MFFSETRGSYYEMGVQFGRETALQLGSMLDWLVKRFRHESDEKRGAIQRDIVKKVERHCPEYLEEIHGITDGAGIPFSWVLLMNFYALAGDGQCSNLVFPQSADGPLLLKTGDLPVKEGHRSGIRLARPSDAPAMIFSTLPGTVWASSGMNEAGLAVGGASCAAKVPVPDEVMSAHVVIRKVLVGAETVADAVAILRGTNLLPSRGMNLAIVDRTGRAVIVEKAGAIQGERWNDGEPVFCTNHALTKNLAPFHTLTREQREESESRLGAMERLGAGRETSVGLAREIAAFDSRPGALCRYGDDDPVSYETEFSVIYFPLSNKAEFCFSHAGRDPWRLFQLSNE